MVELDESTKAKLLETLNDEAEAIQLWISVSINKNRHQQFNLTTCLSSSRITLGIIQTRYSSKHWLMRSWNTVSRRQPTAMRSTKWRWKNVRWCWPTSSSKFPKERSEKFNACTSSTVRLLSSSIPVAAWTIFCRRSTITLHYRRSASSNGERTMTRWSRKEKVMIESNKLLEWKSHWNFVSGVSLKSCTPFIAYLKDSKDDDSSEDENWSPRVNVPHEEGTERD